MSTHDYESLKALAAELGRPLGSLIALSGDHDPFLADRPGRRRAGAEWFAQLWARFNVPNGVHLRRLHYWLVSTTGVIAPYGGGAYLNTLGCWKDLCSASADARFLDLVPAGAFVDRRAAEPIIFFPEDFASDASVTLLARRPEFSEQTDAALLSYEPTQFEFPPLPRFYLSEPKIVEPAIEIWAEKTTMNDILLPLAQARGLGLITGVGELSITHCHALVKRVLEHRRLTIILYISDHDPSGHGMPVSVARKIEFFLRRDGHEDLDIRLIPLILTADQVAEYALPRVPIKETDRRRGQFEAQHGEGAVELDALEALRPGQLRTIIEDAVNEHRNPTRLLRRKIARKAATVRREMQETGENVLAAHANAISGLESSWETAEAEISEHQRAIAEAIAECEQTIAGHEQEIEQAVTDWREDAEPVWEQISNDLEAAAPDPGEIDWPTMPEEEDRDPLFDSRRDYLEQISRYKEHQDKPTARRSVGYVQVSATCIICGAAFTCTKRMKHMVCSEKCKSRRRRAEGRL